MTIATAASPSRRRYSRPEQQNTRQEQTQPAARWLAKLSVVIQTLFHRPACPPARPLARPPVTTARTTTTPAAVSRIETGDRQSQMKRVKRAGGKPKERLLDWVSALAEAANAEISRSSRRLADFPLAFPTFLLLGPPQTLETNSSATVHSRQRLLPLLVLLTRERRRRSLLQSLLHTQRCC